MMSSLPFSCLLLITITCLYPTVYAFDVCERDDGKPPIAIGLAGNQWLVAVFIQKGSTLWSGKYCVYQMPAYAFTQAKVYLTGGKPPEQVWNLSSPISKSNNLGGVISDRKGNHFAVFGQLMTLPPRLLGIDLATGINVIDIDKKKDIKGGKTDIPISTVSSTEPMTVYNFLCLPKVAFLSKFTFDSDNLPFATKKLVSSYKLCESEGSGSQLVAEATEETESEHKNCTKPLQWFKDEKDEDYRNDYWARGLADGKHFYLHSASKIYSFEMAAISDQIGKPVPFSVVEMTDFFVSGPPPEPVTRATGGGNSSSSTEGSSVIEIVVIVVLILILLIIIVVGVYCYCSKKGGKADSQPKRQGKGKGSGSHIKGKGLSKMGSKVSGKTSRRQSLGSKVTNKNGPMASGALSKRSTGLPAFNASKVKNASSANVSNKR